MQIFIKPNTLDMFRCEPILLVICTLITIVNCEFVCKTGCLDPKMSVKHLLNGRKISGNQHYSMPEDPLPIPLWINETLFEVGQKFAQKNVGFLSISHLYSVIFDMALPDFNTVLLAIRTTSIAEYSAKRFTATATQVASWYLHSLNNSEDRKVLKASLQKIHDIHFRVSFYIQQNRRNSTFMECRSNDSYHQLQGLKQRSIFNDFTFWSAFIKDLKESNIPPGNRRFPKFNYNGMPITQFNTAAEQISFVGMAVLFRKELGMTQATDEELRGLIHVWGVFGYMLGLMDEYNPCLQADLATSERIFRDVLQQIFIPSLFELDEIAHIQISSYLDGLYVMDPNFSPGIVAYRLLRDFVKIQPKLMYNQLNVLEKMNVAMFDAAMRENAVINRMIVNRYATYFMEFNGRKFFGREYVDRLTKKSELL